MCVVESDVAHRVGYDIFTMVGFLQSKLHCLCGSRLNEHQWLPRKS
jgi:hypothetical protein